MQPNREYKSITLSNIQTKHLLLQAELEFRKIVIISNYR
mgnify:CR=1 FL=1